MSKCNFIRKDVVYMYNQYDELEYARNIYQNGFQSNYLPTQLRLLAIYMKTELGYKPRQLRAELTAFCQDRLPGYQPAVHYPAINKALRQAGQKGASLLHIKELPIYQWELDFLTAYPLCPQEQMTAALEYNCRKLMFTLLVRTRLRRLISLQKNYGENLCLYFKGGGREYRELKQEAKLPSSQDLHSGLIYHLAAAGAVTPMHDGLLRLDFMEEADRAAECVSCSPTSEPAFSISHFNNAGWYYDYYNRLPRMKLCRHCGSPFKASGNRQLYCPGCTEEMERERWKIRARKHRGMAVPAGDSLLVPADSTTGSCHGFEITIQPPQLVGLECGTVFS